MKYVFYFSGILLLICSCGISQKNRTTTSEKSIEEAVVIKNDSLEYEIIIFDIGFSTYLHTIAKPANYYSQQYYETKNTFYVIEWNIRAMNPLQNRVLYENIIEYDRFVNYGLEVNYKLYNYFKFVEYKYNVRL